MTTIFTKYKKQCIILGIILLIILLAIYLWAMFLPGLWHGDTFLYRQEDGSFKGSDYYAEYVMKISEAEYGKDIDFSVNDKINHYQVKYDEDDLNRKVEVLENGKVICQGKALDTGNSYIVFDDESGSSDMISVRVGNEAPSEDELFPGYSKLYSWSRLEKNDTRGNPYMIIIILILGIILFLDIKFPMLFWILEHRLDVDGGEPSDWYLFGQKVGRILMVIGIFVSTIMTFTIH